jgi:hypothetical protein
MPTDEQMRLVQQILADHLDHKGNEHRFDAADLAALRAFCATPLGERTRLGKTANSLDEALDQIQVEPPGTYEPGPWDTQEHAIHHTWWGVTDGERTIAFFRSERQAFRFRLDLINRMLNG